MTDHEKTIHLLSCVQPAEAKTIVKQFLNLEDCYKPAIEALEERYGSRNKVYSLHVKTFLKAYRAVIYLRAVYSDSSTSVTLVTAKSRVTPVKLETIPRLELTAALMLARLVKATASDLDISLDNCYTWTNSSIVLSWLHHSPATLNTYQANRVAAILDILRRSQWRHVRSPDNPADLPSRGMLPTELIKTPLWWCPPWLLSSPEHWPHTRLTFKESGEGFKPMTLPRPLHGSFGRRSQTLTGWSELSPIVGDS